MKPPIDHFECWLRDAPPAPVRATRRRQPGLRSVGSTLPQAIAAARPT
ncbi:MAG: hypothetical protein KJZ98_09880 [Burkholderiaceae bacterium]|nr:hypothetical protein [Burkholderiaceae bacterium]MEB2350168.1 hypothetical protein [Burkholderiaceae bacterium]